MKLVELKSFLKTGSFGGIEVGISTRQDVIDLMGPKFDAGDFGESQIIKYGWYEFFYWTKSKIVFAIQNDHLAYDCQFHADMIYFKNEQVEIDTWFLKENNNISFSDLIKILNIEHIDYSIKKDTYNNDIEYIQIANGIKLLFDEEITLQIYDELKDEWRFEEEAINHKMNHILRAITLFKYE